VAASGGENIIIIENDVMAISVFGVKCVEIFYAGVCYIEALILFYIEAVKIAMAYEV